MHKEYAGENENIKIIIEKIRLKKIKIKN